MKLFGIIRYYFHLMSIGIHQWVSLVGVLGLDLDPGTIIFTAHDQWVNELIPKLTPMSYGASFLIVYNQ